MSARVVAGAIAFALALAAPRAGFTDATRKLLDALEKDPAYKVRMQALRLLGKQVREKKARIDTDLVERIGRAAGKDESHLVRGLACFVLGQTNDPRARPILAAALRDSNAFVRAQAEDALRLIPPDTPAAPQAPPEEPPPAAVAAVAIEAQPPSEPGGGGDARRPVLVVSVEDTPGVDVPREVMTELERMMRDGFSEKAGARYAVTASGAGRGRGGFRLRGSIAERRIEAGADTRVTVVVRMTIATWPANNLRHVVSARASGTSKSRHESAVKGLEKQVLRAAVSAAVRDAMEELAKRG